MNKLLIENRLTTEEALKLAIFTIADIDISDNNRIVYIMQVILSDIQLTKVIKLAYQYQLKYRA